MFGLVLRPGEADHCLHQLRGGTDVVLIVELVQSIFFFFASYVCFVFYIHFIKLSLLYFHL